MIGLDPEEVLALALWTLLALGWLAGARHPGLVALWVAARRARSPASDRARGQEAGRAEITGSREGAKPRSSDERRTILATPI